MGKILGVTGKYVSVLERGVKDVEDDSTISQLLAVYEERLDKSHSVGLNEVVQEYVEASRKNMQLAGMVGIAHDDGLSSTVRDEPHLKGRFLLKSAREKKGLSQKELAGAVGYSLGIYQNIEEGRSNMSRPMAERVARELEVSVDDLLAGCDEPPSNGGPYGTVGERPDIILPKGMKARFVPLLAMAQCGPNVIHMDEGYTHEGFLAFNPEDPQAFAVKLTGDSMQPVYGPGDVAIIYPSRPPRNGKVVIARLNDDHGGDVVFKLYQASRDQVTLSSYNPAYPPITHAREDFSWIYPVDSVNKKI